MITIDCCFSPRIQPRTVFSSTTSRRVSTAFGSFFLRLAENQLPVLSCELHCKQWGYKDMEVSINGGNLQWIVYNGHLHLNGWWLGVPPWPNGNLHISISYRFLQQIWGYKMGRHGDIPVWGYHREIVFIYSHLRQWYLSSHLLQCLYNRPYIHIYPYMYWCSI